MSRSQARLGPSVRESRGQGYRPSASSEWVKVSRLVKGSPHTRRDGEAGSRVGKSHTRVLTAVESTTYNSQMSVAPRRISDAVLAMYLYVSGRFLDYCVAFIGLRVPCFRLSNIIQLRLKLENQTHIEGLYKAEENSAYRALLYNSKSPK